MTDVEVDLDELRALALASPIYPALIDYVFSGNTPYCKACKTAVPAFRIESHITHNHKQYRNTMRWPVWNYFRALPVAQHWHDLKPLLDNSPIETCIRFPVKGFTCRSCGHKSSHPIGISNHCNKEHNLFIPLHGRQWDDCILQSWRMKRNARWWIVQNLAEGGNHNDASRIDVLDTIVEEEEERQIMLEELLEVEISGSNIDDQDGWLCRTKWPKLFSGRPRRTIRRTMIASSNGVAVDLTIGKNRNGEDIISTSEDEHKL
jgi:hypothetical protein